MKHTYLILNYSKKIAFDYDYHSTLKGSFRFGYRFEVERIEPIFIKPALMQGMENTSSKW